MPILSKKKWKITLIVTIKMLVVKKTSTCGLIVNKYQKKNIVK